MPKVDALKRVQDGNLCAGCGGCALIAPTKVRMALSEPGYARPELSAELSVEENRQIDAVCPGLRQKVVSADRYDDVLWGPYLDVSTGHATDPELRFKASSGGALSAILQFLVDSGRVDGVVETGPDADLPTANATVLNTSRGDILASAGSRYAPSSPLAGLDIYLGGPKKYAIVGKPCDIAALRALSALRPEVSSAFPYMLSFFCAGVPSLTGAEQILKTLNVELGDTAEFRYRGYGWPGRAVAKLRDGTERSMSYVECWRQFLSKYVKHRCKICADGTGVAADIVCADVWETDDRGYPLFEEKDGQSLVMARTPLGQEVIHTAVGDGVIELEPYDIKMLERIQPGQSARRKALLARLLALKLIGSSTPNYRGLHLFRAAKKNSLSGNLRNFVGMVRRRLGR
ncbi:MAG: Coenzyme F420 hydrogenase/dehydrogenase, beta subunit C-terminal domain [Pseudomonadota bacterium]